MAVEAILPDRRMLEKKGAALVGMTGITDFIDAIGLEKRRSG